MLFNRIVKIFFIFLLVWNSAILVAPVLVTTDVKILQILGSAIYFFMDPVCHQIPQRSLSFVGIHFPVCSRCTAIYFTGMFVVLSVRLKKQFKPWPQFIYFIFAALIIAEIISEKMNLINSFTELRLISGVMMGIFIFRVILEGLFYGSRK